MKQKINTIQAPTPIGAYSQAIKVGKSVFVSGQIPLDLNTSELIVGDFSARVHQVFRHIQAVAQAAGGQLSDIVKLTVFLTDIRSFTTVNAVMQELFLDGSFPARSLVQVSALPKQADVEIEAILELSE